ncbi:TetR family transcriptional regulator [soil metagenome]
MALLAIDVKHLRERTFYTGKMSTSVKVRKPSEARQRLLDTASEIFYRSGIHSVGVDRVIAQAGVTRATFYRHFPGKEDLVQAYLEEEDAHLRAQFAAASELGLPPDQMLDVIITSIADDVSHNHTRGCPFINASAEYPDADSPVRRTVAAHREWFRATLRAALEAAGRSDPAEKAGALVLLRDAALVGGYLDGPDTIRETFIDTARMVVRAT